MTATTNDKLLQKQLAALTKRVAVLERVHGYGPASATESQIAMDAAKKRDAKHGKFVGEAA